MCGIVAIAKQHGEVSASSLQAATAKLSHRGPDGSRVWLSSNACVGLGHARLSIIDLHTGDQPLSNEDGTIHAVVNGEFYGYISIREELESRGHRFQTKSDSEILLHLYEEVGYDCVHRLRGEFAFVLWDERKKVLFAARDRCGIKPLYYSQSPDGLYLASEAKALFAAGVRASWDADGFFYATQGLTPPDSTLFAGVRQVPGGTYMVAEDNRLELKTYWDFNYPLTTEIPNASESTSIESLKSALDQAVRIRLVADVPVGVYLSGGIDSSAVLGIASQYTSALDCFSVFFPDDIEHNEEDRIKETCARSGARLHCVSVTGDLAAEHFTSAVTQWEELPRSEWIVGKYLLSKLVRDHGTKVVLTGEGSDEIFGGQPPLVQDGKSANAVMPAPTPGQPLSHVRNLLGYVPSQILFREIGRSRLRPLLSAEHASYVKDRDPFSEILGRMDLPKQLAGRERLSQSMYLWSKTMLQNFFLTACGDRSEMAHSVEGRLPFLDHEVIECVRSMPSSMKLKGSVVKHVLREAVRGVITDTVYQAEKKGFVTQLSRVAQPGTKMFALAQDTLRSNVLGDVPFFDRQGIVKILDSLPSLPEAQRHAWDPVLLNALGACILQQAYRL
jgi:asparagine synthase (glutamine-hydrolysing)